MPTTQLLPVPRMQFFDSNGDPLAGGFLYAYAAGTSTPQNTYADESGTVPNSNPVTLDSGGFAEVWLDASLQYKFVLTDSNGGQIWTVDNVYSIIPGTALTSLAQTWTALQTFQDLAIKGPFPATWPNAANNQLLIAGTDNTHSLGTSVIGRVYCGDGTGWYLGIAKRVGGVDTDLYKFRDSGIAQLGASIDLGIDVANDVNVGSNGTGGFLITSPQNSSTRGDCLAKNLSLTGKVNQYNGFLTAANGVGSILASLDTTVMSSVPTQTLLATAPVGVYAIHYYIVCTIPASGQTITPAFGWTDENGSQTVNSSAMSTTTVTNSVNAGLFGVGNFTFYHADNTKDITYAAAVSGGTPRCNIRIRLMYLG